MRELMNRRTARFLAVSAVALVTVGAALGGAQAASLQTPQLGPGCSPVVTSLTGNSVQVFASFTQTCTVEGETIIHDFPVSLSRLVNGTWVTLASGEGVAAYECVGTTTYEYSGAGHTGTFACG
jgi:hypothetical protein